MREEMSDSPPDSPLAAAERVLRGRYGIALRDFQLAEAEVRARLADAVSSRSPEAAARDFGALFGLTPRSAFAPTPDCVRRYNLYRIAIVEAALARTGRWDGRAWEISSRGRAYWDVGPIRDAQGHIVGCEFLLWPERGMRPIRGRDLAETLAAWQAAPRSDRKAGPGRSP